jgi:hypothetical protein
MDVDFRRHGVAVISIIKTGTKRRVTADIDSPP